VANERWLDRQLGQKTGRNLLGAPLAPALVALALQAALEIGPPALDRDDRDGSGDS
jgi:hypothetical protein